MSDAAAVCSRLAREAAVIDHADSLRRETRMQRIVAQLKAVSDIGYTAEGLAWFRRPLSNGGAL